MRFSLSPDVINNSLWASWSDGSFADALEVYREIVPVDGDTPEQYTEQEENFFNGKAKFARVAGTSEYFELVDLETPVKYSDHQITYAAGRKLINETPDRTLCRIKYWKQIIKKWHSDILAQPHPSELSGAEEDSAWDRWTVTLSSIPHDILDMESNDEYQWIYLLLDGVKWPKRYTGWNRNTIAGPGQLLFDDMMASEKRAGKVTFWRNEPIRGICGFVLLDGTHWGCTIAGHSALRDHLTSLGLWSDECVTIRGSNVLDPDKAKYQILGKPNEAQTLTLTLYGLIN